MNSTAADRRVGLVWFPKGSNLAASKRHQVATPERGGGGAETARQRGEQTHRPAGPRNIKLHERLCKIPPRRVRMEDKLQFEHIRGKKWLDLNGCVSLDPGIQQGPPMSRQTDHILYKFQGCSTRGRRPATASRSLRTGQRQADAGGPQSIVGRRWQRNRRCDGLIKPQVTTISGRPRPPCQRQE